MKKNRVIDIQSGVLPRRNAKSKYPFDKLKAPELVGTEMICDYFFVPGKIGEDLSGSIKHYENHTPGAKFKTRRSQRDGVNGVEIWRIR